MRQVSPVDSKTIAKAGIWGRMIVNAVMMISAETIWNFKVSCSMSHLLFSFLLAAWRPIAVWCMSQLTELLRGLVLSLMVEPAICFLRSGISLK